MSNISDMVLKKEAAWKDEDYRNAAMNVVLPVGGAAAGYGLTNALVDDASTGMKIGGAGLGAAAALITSLYLQNMDKGAPADTPAPKLSEQAEQELKDVASDWSPRGAIGLSLGVGAGGMGAYGAYRAGKGLLKGVGSALERVGDKAGHGATTLIGKGTTIAGKGIYDTAKTAYDAISGKSVKDALDATRAAGKETTEGIWNLKGLLKLIKKVKKVAP